MNKLTVNNELCVGCGMCMRDCFGKHIQIIDKKAVIDTENQCMNCDHCLAVCPMGAISRVDIDQPENIDKKKIAIETSDLFELIRSKRSNRHYTGEPVEKEAIDMILEAGRISPTATNSQGLKFTVVNSPEKMDQLRSLCLKTATAMSEHMEGRYKALFAAMEENYNANKIDRIFHGAPTIIIIHGNPAESNSLTLDTGIAAGQMSLLAETQGLGSCFIGFLPVFANANPMINEILEIPKEEKIVTSLIIGKAKVNYKRGVNRKPLRANYL